MIYELMEFDFDPDCLDYYGGEYFSTKEEAEVALIKAIEKQPIEQRIKAPFEPRV